MERKYHSYLFFDLDRDYFQLPKVNRLGSWVQIKPILDDPQLIVEHYLTLGFKSSTKFMLWVRAERPEQIQGLVRELTGSELGKFLRLTYSYFGMERISHYSGRMGRKEQMMQTYDKRLPYFVLYPFSKTADWHLLPFEKRKELMNEHIKIGIGHPSIRQCLVYSYGLDDNEFVVSYETEYLDEFQDLVIELRPTAVRKYTLSDTPIFTCIYKSKEEFLEWL